MKFFEEFHPLQDESVVHIWIIDLKKPISVDMSIFHSEELIRAENYKLKKPKEIFLSSRYALRMLLARYLKRDPKQINFFYNKNGKPYLQSDTVAPCFQFNVTHCGNMACIAFAKKGEVGVDVEQVSFTNLLDSQDIFMNNNEMECLKEINKGKELALYHVWTQKEAYLKAIGTGFVNSPTLIDSYVTPVVNLKNMNIKNHKVNSFLLDSNIIALCTNTDVEVEFYHFDRLNLIESVYQKQKEY